MGRITLVIMLFPTLLNMLQSQTHPNLTLTLSSVEQIRGALGEVPLFDKALAAAISEVDAEIELGVIVPVPKDMSGGYTHERHKQNFFILQKAGNLYQITKEEKYAKYIKASLLAYAKLYPTLGLHPTNRSYSTGKIFWQCLNDANWLVYVSQAYDCVYDYLTVEEREHLETDLFKPFADFISIGNPKFFNRIHNHSTWGNAAVGMIGLVMNDQELINRSLYGIQDDGIDENEIDNDGGYIKEKSVRKAGFLAQLDFSFAPDGYFTEGPYYLRYAIFPFLVYAKALHNHQPELNIFQYREGILTKAVDALLLQTDHNGEFFPINDAQKGMSWKARELITAVDLMYAYNGKDESLLSVAENQNTVLIDDAGFEVAKAIKEGKGKPYTRRSVVFGDGEKGDEGGVAVIRNKETCLVMKYSAQGMGHGHFDKLSYSLYDGTGEVVQDYGAVRWVNVDQKGGGRYLPENKTFGKQSIAHNTIVVNETSHYEGSVKKGEQHHPELFSHDFSDPNCQVISAKENNAYNGVEMHRTLFVLEDNAFNNPIIIDIFNVTSEMPSQFDLPIWYKGHLLSTDFNFEKKLASLQTLGSDDGYQHLWREATGKTDKGQLQLTWFAQDKFYTMTSVVDANDELIMARLGANDPNFNFRSDPVFIQRKKGEKETVFVNLIESHGTYDRVTETPLDPFSKIKTLKILLQNDLYTVLYIKSISDQDWVIAIANEDSNRNSKHRLELDGKIFEWQGFYGKF